MKRFRARMIALLHPVHPARERSDEESEEWASRQLGYYRERWWQAQKREGSK